MADAIGSLFIDLSMQTASFDAATKRVETQVRGLTSKITTGFAAIKGVIAASGLVIAAQQTVQWAKSMADAGEQAVILSQSLGLTLEQVVRLQGAFQLTEGSVDAAAAALLKLSGVITDARGGSEQALASFKAIGISLNDLNKHGDDLEKMLTLVAGRLSEFEDGTAKSAVAADLLGRGWKTVSALVSGGAEALEKAKQRAAELAPNAVEAAEAGNRLATQFDELKQAANGLADEGLLLLEGKISSSTIALMGFVAWARKAIEAMRTLNAGAPGFGEKFVEGVTTFLGKMPVNTMWGFIGRKLGLPGPGFTSGEPIELPQINVTASQSFGGGGDVKKKIGIPNKKGGGGGGGKEDEVDKEWKEAIATFKELAEEAEEAALAMADGMKDISDELFDRRVKQIRNQLDLEKISGREAVDAERKVAEEKWEAHKEFYRQKREAAEGDKKKLADLDRQEKLEHEKHLTELGQLDHDKVKLRFDDFKDAARDLGNVLENSFSNAFDGITDGTFKLRTAIGGLLKDLGRMIASKAFQMLLNGGSSSSSGGGLLGSLFGLFTGGGGVGKGGPFGDGWSAAELGMPALASGGSFRVGGSGGIDSQLIAARMTPGELVEVTPPGQAGGGSGGEININLNPSEGWVAGVADQRIVTASGQIIKVSVSQSTKAVQRNWSGMSSEASQRQL